MKKEGFVLPIMLIVMVVISLLCLQMLDSAVLDQRLSSGFLSAVKMDQAVLDALKQGEKAVQQGHENNHGLWISTQTTGGILAAYQFIPQGNFTYNSTTGNVVLICAKAGNTEDPDQIEWQAYWAGGEQSRRRVK